MSHLGSYSRIPESSALINESTPDDAFGSRRPFSSNNEVSSKFQEHGNADAYSDSEAGYYASGIPFRRGNQFSSSLPTKTFLGGQSHENDEFGESQNLANKTVRTGRQRKKQAARSKGGEFQTRRKKRRVYFCCVSSEIDIQKLYDYLVGSGGLFGGWRFKLYNDVLHLYKGGTSDDVQSSSNYHSDAIPVPVSVHTGVSTANGGSNNQLYLNPGERTVSHSLEIAETPRLHPLITSYGYNKASISNEESRMREKNQGRPSSLSIDGNGTDGELDAASRVIGSPRGITAYGNKAYTEDSLWRLSLPRAQEVFVFNFGAVVFWGFSRGEETNLLRTIRIFVATGFVGAHEFHSGEDDMAFVISPESELLNDSNGTVLSIANEVIALAEDTPPEQRLSVSFAIAQSSVLSIFESRVEKKVEEYKYIPEALAAYGKVQLSERQLGTMIGEVYVIRHDVNLHSEILDTPDWFWKREHHEKDYKMVMNYLEMSTRTEVLNKRLDMLRELLNVLQQQMETAHAVKLEWIVIWLIVIEVVLQLLAVSGESLGWYRKN